MKRKCIAITLFVLLFVSLFHSGVIADNGNENDKVTEKITVYLTNCNMKYLQPTSSVEVSYTQAKQIKNRFLEIEKNYHGIDKINRQIKILKEIHILSSDFSVNTLLSALDKYHICSVSKFSLPLLKLTLGGPYIVSHLTIGGRINGLFSLKPILYNSTNITFHHIFNGSYINRVYGVLPIYVGAVLRPVFITIIGPQRMINAKMCFFPFFEILCPCIGFSVAFYYMNKHALFEYNVDACLTGYVTGFKL